MSENLFIWLTPFTYWLLIILWAFILIFYFRVLRNWQHTSTAMKVLLWVLCIDAIRTLFESIYFGSWYTARAGMLPKYIFEFLVQPQNVFIPKLINVIAGGIILLLLLRRCLPHWAEELETQSTQIEQHAKAQEIAHLGNWELNIKTNELFWSDEIYRIFGLEPHQFGGTYEAFLQSVHPDDQSQVEEAVKRALNHRDYRYSIEHRVVRPDGSLRTVQEIGKVLRNREGQPLSMSGTVQDITERKRVEDELKQAKEEAEGASKIKSRFLSNMSHELRPPLNAILGFSDMMVQDRSTTADQQKKLAAINRSGEHLLCMINDVLDLSKIEAGRVELEPEVFDLAQVLHDIDQMINVRIEESNIRLIIDHDDELARYVKADMGKLRQILINLLDNAIKFTTEGGVSLRARTQAMANDSSMVTLQLEVEDTGPGIPEEELGRIFDPFIQAVPIKNGPKGTGLGLTITRSFVELMGGTINVESEIGRGSLFRVDLPAVLAETADKDIEKSVRPVVVGRSPGQPEWRILVVEDNAENRLLLSSLLVQAGFEIREAENGKEGVALFEQWQPHFIWMDMRMPVMDGYKATAKIRELPGGDRVKIVAITASVFREQRKSILDIGCDALVHKPFRPHEIFDVMAEQLDVGYHYKGKLEERTTHRRSVPAVNLTDEVMAGLPADLRQALGVTAHNLDVSATAQVIERIRSDHPDIADGLQLMADQFKFGQILELLGGRK